MRFRAARLALTALLSLAVSPAHGEVWPTTGRALVLGAENWLEGGALGLVENPALLSRARRWSLGVGWLEPYGVREFTRWDLAASAGLGAGGVGLAWSQLGREAWGARRLSLGVASRLVADHLSLGGSVHRATRAETQAWSADLGLCAQPARELQIGLTARSVWRGGERTTAPESEWAASLVWRPEPLALGYSMLRDAVGPIENRWSARVSMGPVDTHLAYADRVGEEWRVALALSLRLFATRLAVGQESGRRLPESRGGTLELELPASRPTTAPARGALHWGLDAGVVGRGERGLGLRGGVEWSRQTRDGSGFVLAASGSRDPGEPSGLDEGRAYARIAKARLGEWHAGALDLHLGRGLVVSRNGGHAAAGPGVLAAVENGAGFERAPVPAPTGVAAQVGGEGRSRWLAAWTRIERDARPLAGGLWPVGGRLHRTETERDRRGALAEELTVLAYAHHPRPEWAIGFGLAAVRHGAAAPRLVPGGLVRSGGGWITTMGLWRHRAGRLSWEAALDRTGRSALSLYGRFSTSPRRARLRLEFLLERAPPGYAAATAWPSLARLTNLFARAELSPLAAPWLLSLARRVEERWQAPTTTLPARRQWIVQSSATVTRRTDWGSLGLEAGVREEQRTQSAVATGDPLWSASTRGWWSGSWIWRPGDAATLRLRPSWRRYASGWRESWSLTVSGTGILQWEVEAILRPGGTVSEEEGGVEGDPLGGVRLDPSTSPARLRLRAGRGATEAEFRWSETTAGPRPEIWLRVRGTGAGGLW